MTAKLFFWDRCTILHSCLWSLEVLLAMQEVTYERPDGALWAVQMRWVGWKEGDLSRDIMEAEPPKVEHPQERSQKKSRHIQFHFKFNARQNKSCVGFLWLLYSYHRFHGLKRYRFILLRI